MSLYSDKSTIKKLPLLLVGCLFCLNTQANAGSSPSYEIYLGPGGTFITSEDIILNPTSHKGVIYMYGGFVTILNNHLLKIENSTSSSNLNGIYLSNLDGIVLASSITAADYANIQNNGTINLISHTVGQDLSGIFTENIIDSSISNTGNIISNNTNFGRARGIMTDNMINSSITNTGKISLSSSYVTIGIQTELLDAHSTILNSGTITNTGDPLISVGIFAEGGGGTITNTGSITADLAILTMTYNGTITNEATGILNGHIYAPSATLINNEEINIPFDFDLVGEGAYSTLVKNYTQSATSSLGIKLNIADDGSSTYSHLSATNSATLADGTMINVDVTASDIGAGAFLDANSILTGVISSDNTIDVDTSLLDITDNSALLNFKALLSLGGTSLNLQAVQGASILDAVTQSGQIRKTSVARVLDDATDNDITTFKTHLNSLPTNEAVANALTQVTPENTLNTQNVSYQITNAMSHVVQARQSSVRGFNAGDTLFSDKNVWVKPFGGYTSQDDVDGIDGFSANTYGFGMGADGEYKNGSRMGLAFFYTKADMDTNNVNQSSDLDVFNLVVYGSNPILDDKTNLFYQISYGLQKTDAKRVISGIGTASTDYTSKNFFAQIKAIKDIQINEDFKIRPALVSSYTYFHSPSYSESGVGGLNLNVEKFSSDSIVVGIESDFIYTLDETSKLSANVGLSHDFNNKAQTLTSSFRGGGSVFSTEGIENSSFIYKAGFGYVKKLQNNLFIDMQYNFEGRGNDIQNHVISSKINYKF